MHPAAASALLFGAALLAPTKASSTFQSQCLSFTPDQFFANATATTVEYVTAGSTLLFPDNVASCGRKSQKVEVDMCRVVLSIATTPRSSIRMEAWLPEEWTGRFLATGNDGIGGCIKYEDLAYAAANGFAVVGANNGKDGTEGLPFLNNPDVVVDFAWRSLHTAVETGKELASNLYGSPHTKSYYLGCSLGGRQGIKSAEQFPADFDGIVAGAPAVDFNNLISWRARFVTITGAAESRDFIPATAWKTWIHDEVLRQCDNLDGLEDGIIEEASMCHFNATELLCNDESGEKNCLSSSQVQQLDTIFSDYEDTDGRLIYPGMQPGSEKNAIERLYAGKPFPYSEDWFRYVVYNDSTWDGSTFSDSDMVAAEKLNPANIRTFPSSLPDFERCGGKILMYHGQQDQQITSRNSERFYTHLKGHRSTADMDEWIRYFRVSGMNHCNSGPGAWVMGQGGNGAAAGAVFEKERNVLKAVVDWVELGVAPEYIEATKFRNDTVELGVDFTRRHCKYPLRNVYTVGDPKDASSWQCV